MFRVRAYALPLVALGTGYASADEVTYVANFGSSTLDSSLAPYGTGSTFAVSSGAGELTVSKAATSTDVAGIAGVTTNFSMPGDFTASVTLDFSGAGISTGTLFVGGSFTANSASGALSDQGGYNTSSGGNVSGDYYPSGANGTPTTFISVPFNSPVMLEVERVGDAITELYGPVGGSLTTINTLSGSEFEGPTFLTLGLYDNGTGTTAAGSVSFSNFQVTYDTPEPSSFALLMCGLLALALMSFRRTQPV